MMDVFLSWDGPYCKTGRFSILKVSTESLSGCLSHKLKTETLCDLGLGTSNFPSKPQRP